MGRQLAVEPNFRTSVEDIQLLYSAVQEVYSMAESVPIGSGMDIAGILTLAEKGTTLEVPELQDVSQCLTSLQELVQFFRRDGRDPLSVPTPRLQALVKPIYLDPKLVELLYEAFDETGELCGKKFPEIGRLRQRIDKLYIR